MINMKSWHFGIPDTKDNFEVLVYRQTSQANAFYEGFHLPVTPWSSLYTHIQA